MDGMAEVIHGIDGRILGVCIPVQILDDVISRYEEWLIHNGLFCLVNAGTAKSPCVKVLKRIDDAISTVWGSSCEGVVLNRAFVREHIEKPTFPELIKNIRKYYHNRVIIDGCQSTWEYSVLQDCGVWAVQSYMYRHVSVLNLSYLM